MTLEEKVKLYEATLNRIAQWEEGKDLTSLDEPAAACKARQVLQLARGEEPDKYDIWGCKL